MQAAMNATKQRLKALQNTTWRRLRITPSYFLLFWRWSTWLFALIVILFTRNAQSSYYSPTNVFLLVVIFLYTLFITLNTPPFQLLNPWLSKRPFSWLRKGPFLGSLYSKPKAPPEDEDAEILAPLALSQNHVWNISLHCLDIIICGLATYFAGAYSNPPFGNGSPFYRYGMSAAFAAALTYRFPGAIIAGLAYDCIALLGVFLPAPGTVLQGYVPNAVDITSTLMDTPLAGIMAAILVTLVANYARSKKREQDNVRRARALLEVGEIIMSETSDRQQLLHKSAEQLRKGGHFHFLVIALVEPAGEDEASNSPEISTRIEVSITDSLLLTRDEHCLAQVLRSRQLLAEFDRPTRASGHYGIARMYVPIFKDDQLQMILGAESRRLTPFDARQETFLDIAGGNLSIALDNMRLAEQTIALAATAERSRIAREIHDGIAQLTYMLSLQAETCATQAHRIVEASEEDAELITPLAERLDKLVTVSKQALWETRNYMFSLKPLMSGTTTLTQMISSQVREFEAISDLPVRLDIEGSEPVAAENLKSARRRAMVGTAIFRIVQEALTNAYKHAEASHLEVHLRNWPESIEVEVCDNGSGLEDSASNGQTMSSGALQRIYSGHGMIGMRERAEELGGTFEVVRTASSGLTIRAQIPL